MKKAKKVIWGVLLLTAGVGILLSALGIELGFIGRLSAVDLLLGIVLVAVTACLAVDRRWWALPFPIAAVFFVFREEIMTAAGKEGEEVSAWIVLGCALLASAGIKLITSSGKKKAGAFTADKDTSEFSSSTRYIDCPRFTEETYALRMGDGNIYFEHPEAYQGNGVLTVNCKMGNVDIHVPATWRIRCDMVFDMGNIDMPSGGPTEGPLLIINGTCKLGNVDIHYC